MKFTGLLFLFLIICYSATAQDIEIPVESDVPPEFIIKRVEIRPSLTNLAPEIPNTGRFRIREVNFDKGNERREIDIAAVMAREERMKSRIIELAPPVQVPQVTSNNSGRDSDGISVTPRFFNQSFSPQLPGRGTRNSVYRDASIGTGAAYYNSYNPFMRSRYYRPGYGYY